MSVNNQSNSNEDSQADVDTEVNSISSRDELADPMAANNAARRMAQQFLNDDEDENGSQIPNGLTKEQYQGMKNAGLDPNTTLAGNGLSSDVAQTNEIKFDKQNESNNQSATGDTQNNQQMTTEYQKNPAYKGINGSDPIPVNGNQTQNQNQAGGGLQQQPSGPNGQLVQNGLVNEPENRIQQGPKGPQGQQQGGMQPGQSYLVTPLTPEQAQQFNHTTMQPSTMEKSSQRPNAGLEESATKNKDKILSKQNEQNKDFNVESGKNADKDKFQEFDM